MASMRDIKRRKVSVQSTQQITKAFKNNRPKYLLVDLESTSDLELTDDEKIDVVAARILKKYKPAFVELAK